MTLKLGPHIRGNNSNHDIDGRLFNVDWPVMTWLSTPSEWARLDAYHAKHPRTVITGRIPAVEDYYKPRVAVADPIATGEYAAEMIIAMNAPHYVYWRSDELNNEIAWSAAFHLAFLRRLVPAGLRGCGPTFAEGNPRIRRFDGVSDWPAFQDLLAYINGHSESTLLAVNAYRTGTALLDDAAHLLRFEDVIAYLDEWGYNNVRLVLGETGVEVPLLNTKPNDLWLFNHAKDINRLLNNYPRVIGGAWYDFSNIAGLYSAYGDEFLTPFIAWAKAELANAPTPAPGPIVEVPPPHSNQVVVNSSAGLRLRTGPSTNDRILTVLPNGTPLTLTGEQSGPFKQVSCWVHQDYIKGA